MASGTRTGRCPRSSTCQLPFESIGVTRIWIALGISVPMIVERVEDVDCGAVGVEAEAGGDHAERLGAEQAGQLVAGRPSASRSGRRLRAIIRNTGVSMAMRISGLPRAAHGQRQRGVVGRGVPVIGFVAGDRRGAAVEVPCLGGSLEAAVRSEDVVALVAPLAEGLLAPAQGHDAAWAVLRRRSSATSAVRSAKIELDFIRANLSVCTTNSLASGPSWQLSHLPEWETSDFAPLPRDRFALIQLTYVGAACVPDRRRDVRLRKIEQPSTQLCGRRTPRVTVSLTC